MKCTRFISVITAVTMMFSGMTYISFDKICNEITAAAFSLKESYPNSAVYTAECLINGLIDIDTGKYSESYTKYSDVKDRNYAYEQLANNVMEDQGRVISSEMWDTFNRLLDGKLLTAVSGELRQEQVYEIFLMDYLTFSTGSTEDSGSILNEAGNFADKTAKYETNIMKLLIEKGVADDEETLIDLIESSDSLNNTKIVEAMKELNLDKELLGYTELLEDINQVGTSAAEYFEKLSKGLALKEVNEDRINFLKAMEEKASDNTAFQMAAAKIRVTYESSYGTVAFGAGVETMLTYGFNLCWETMTKENPIAIAGKTIRDSLDLLFDTNDKASNNIRIIMQYTAGQYAQQVLNSSYYTYMTTSTEENASVFNNAYKNYLAYQDYSSEWAKNFVKAFTSSASSINVDAWLSDLNSDISYCNVAIKMANKYAEIYNNVVYSSDDEYVWYLEPSIEADDINVVAEVLCGQNYGYFIESKYYVIIQNDKYGFIDMEGNIVVEPKYFGVAGGTNNHYYINSWSYMYSDYTFCTEFGSMHKRNYKKCEDCNADLNSSSDEYFGCYDNERKLFSRSPNAIPSDGRVGGATLSEGIITNDYSETAQLATFSDDNKSAKLYNKFGVVKNGEIIVDFDYDSALTYKDGVTAMKKGDIWEYFNENGDMLFSTDCVSGLLEDLVIRRPTPLPYLASYNYIAVNDNIGGGYYDINGNSVIPVGAFESVRPVYENKAWVKDKETGLWGVLDIEKTVDKITSSSEVFGDIDEDGKVQVSDATLVLDVYSRNAAGLDISKYTDNQKKAADVNKDGKIDISDATAILTYYAQNAAGLNPTWDKIVV